VTCRFFGLCGIRRVDDKCSCIIVISHVPVGQIRAAQPTRIFFTTQRTMRRTQMRRFVITAIMALAFAPPLAAAGGGPGYGSGGPGYGGYGPGYGSGGPGYGPGEPGYGKGYPGYGRDGPAGLPGRRPRPGLRRARPETGLRQESIRRPWCRPCVPGSRPQAGVLPPVPAGRPGVALRAAPRGREAAVPTPI